MHIEIQCILTCDFRYMMQYGRILQRQELDAFLAMSVSPLLHDVQTMQDLKVLFFPIFIWDIEFN